MKNTVGDFQSPTFLVRYTSFVQFPYTVKRSERARSLRLSVLPGGNVVLTAPVFFPEAHIQEFLQKHSSWIEKNTQKMRSVSVLPVSGRRAYLAHREKARAFIHERLVYWNQFYRFTYGRVSIKNTKRLWGSCSRKGNLNFSYALLFLAHELAEYVVVHELCHLKEHNHGAEFWKLVEKTIPEYRKRRTQLRSIQLG